MIDRKLIATLAMWLGLALIVGSLLNFLFLSNSPFGFDLDAPASRALLKRTLLLVAIGVASLIFGIWWWRKDRATDPFREEPWDEEP